MNKCNEKIDFYQETERLYPAYVNEKSIDKQLTTLYSRLKVFERKNYLMELRKCFHL